MLRDINLLPTAYKPKPLINIRQLAGIITLIIFLAAVAYYTIWVNVWEMPRLNREISSAKKELDRYQSAAASYHVLENKNRYLSNINNIVEQLKTKNQNINGIFTEIYNLMPQGGGFVITAVKYGENGTINISGKASGTRQIDEYINNLNDFRKNKFFTQFSLLRLQEDKDTLTFEIEGKVKRGSVLP